MSNKEEREEAGTPNLIADVKLGLVIKIKQSFGIIIISFYYYSSTDSYYKVLIGSKMRKLKYLIMLSESYNLVLK